MAHGIPEVILMFKLLDIFQNANLGTFNKSTTTSITLGGELQVYPSTETAVTMYYSFNGFSLIHSLPKNRNIRQ